MEQFFFQVRLLSMALLRIQHQQKEVTIALQNVCDRFDKFLCVVTLQEIVNWRGGGTIRLFMVVMVVTMPNWDSRVEVAAVAQWRNGGNEMWRT